MPVPATQEELEAVFAQDASFAAQRDAHYEASWKQRGGQGAFFTITRPWDRFEAIAKRGILTSSLGDSAKGTAPYDILGIIQHELDEGQSEADDGTLQACIRDLRIYMALLAVEAQRMRKVYSPPRTLATGISPTKVGEGYTGNVYPAAENPHQTKTTAHSK